MIALLLGTAMAAPIGFDRVDLVSATPGTWFNYDLPAMGTNATTGAVRFLTQVQPWFTTPVEGLGFGVSIQTQTLMYSHPVAGPFSVGGGLQTDLLLPRGAVVEASGRFGPVRCGLGLSALSGATWARPSWSSWDLMPTVSVGLGPRPD